MWNIQSDARGRHRLIDHDEREIAWVHGRAMRFHRIATEEQAVEAASAAWQVLQAALATSDAGVRFNPSLHRLQLVHDGAYEWISDGRIPIARLYRPDKRDAVGGNFAIELLVPSYAPEDLALDAARAIALVLAMPGGVATQPTLPAA